MSREEPAEASNGYAWSARISEANWRFRKRQWILMLSANAVAEVIALADAGSPLRWPVETFLIVIGSMSLGDGVLLALDWFVRERRRRVQSRRESSMARFSVQSLTSLAAFLAGREGPTLYAEWNAVLAGESGHDPASWANVKMAAGFVIAGARDRGQEWADAVWRPVDVLRSRTLSNLFVLLPTGADAYVVLRHEGTLGLLTTFESIFVCGVMLYGVIKAGRWYRDVEPPEPKARQARKQDRGT